ncbi:MAG: hypothetical protein KDK37_12545, partial [Leptospiraceae bacterium]|nr:hypothetical protein [Leptospiraceae bacterium]
MNQTVRRILIGLLVLSYVLLIAWAFQDVRVFTRVQIAHFLGWHSGAMPEETEEAIALRYFKPVSKIVPESENIPEYPAYPVFEFHGHLFPSYKKDLFEEMTKNHISMFVDLALLTTTLEKYDALRAGHQSPRLVIFPGLNYDRLDESGDPFQKMADDLEAIAKAHKIKGLKLWKDLGLYRKFDGKL